MNERFTVPVKIFKTQSRVTIGCSNRKIHSIGHLMNNDIPINCPKNEVNSATVTKSCTTIIQPEKWHFA